MGKFCEFLTDLSARHTIVQCTIVSNFLLYFFRENKGCHFMLLADNSHEISSLIIFSVK